MQYNVPKSVGLFHLCGMIIENIYGFIIRKNILFDKLYIISFASIPFSWIICKDECIISYIMKKYDDPTYIFGNEPENVKDISDFFTNEAQYIMFYNINNLLRICSVIIVNNRTTNIDSVIFIPTCILFLCYNYDITYKLDYRKKGYPYFQIIFGLYLCITMYTAIGV